VVRKLVELIPGDFLSQKVFDPGLVHDLRQGSRIAEYVRNPNVLGLIAELFLEKVFAKEDLADQRFAGDQIAIGFHPHRANRLPLSATDSFFYALPDLGIVGLHPGVLLCLRADKDVAGIFLHVVQRGGKRAGTLANRLPQRPEPGCVNVGVTNRGKRMDGIPVVTTHDTAQCSRCPLDGGGIVLIEFVDRLVQGIAQFGAAL